MDIQDLMKHTLDQSILIPSEVGSVMMWRCARERNAAASPVTALLPYLGGVIAVNKLMFTLAEYVRHAASTADHLQTRVLQLSFISIYIDIATLAEAKSVRVKIFMNKLPDLFKHWFSYGWKYY